MFRCSEFLIQVIIEDGFVIHSIPIAPIEEVESNADHIIDCISTIIRTSGEAHDGAWRILLYNTYDKALLLEEF